MTGQATLLLLGGEGGGKTALVHRYVQGGFSSDYDPHVVDVYKKEDALDDVAVVLDIVDVCGSDTFHEIRAHEAARAHAYIFVVDAAALLRPPTPPEPSPLRSLTATRAAVFAAAGARPSVLVLAKCDALKRSDDPHLAQLVSQGLASSAAVADRLFAAVSGLEEFFAADGDGAAGAHFYPPHPLLTSAKDDVGVADVFHEAARSAIPSLKARRESAACLSSSLGSTGSTGTTSPSVSGSGSRSGSASRARRRSSFSSDTVSVASSHTDGSVHSSCRDDASEASWASTRTVSTASGLSTTQAQNMRLPALSPKGPEPATPAGDVVPALAAVPPLPPAAAAAAAPPVQLLSPREPSGMKPLPAAAVSVTASTPQTRGGDAEGERAVSPEGFTKAVSQLLPAAHGRSRSPMDLLGRSTSTSTAATAAARAPPTGVTTPLLQPLMPVSPRAAQQPLQRHNSGSSCNGAEPPPPGQQAPRKTRPARSASLLIMHPGAQPLAMSFSAAADRLGNTTPSLGAALPKAAEAKRDVDSKASELSPTASSSAAGHTPAGMGPARRPAGLSTGFSDFNELLKPSQSSTQGAEVSFSTGDRADPLRQPLLVKDEEDGVAPKVQFSYMNDTLVRCPRTRTRMRAQSSCTHHTATAEESEA
eukprot:Rhum_TRINITY_DN8544_c0_g1::Rhum_TRINITY_DN8544_c0_g1_i1::g.28404::m.28404